MFDNYILYSTHNYKTNYITNGVELERYPKALSLCVSDVRVKLPGP